MKISIDIIFPKVELSLYKSYQIYDRKNNLNIIIVLVCQLDVIMN